MPAVSTLQPMAQSAPDWIVPDLVDCDPGIRPVDVQCLVIMNEPPEKTQGGIFMPPTAKDREAYGSSIGRLVAVSPFAFSYAKDRPQKEGDLTWPEGGKPKPGDMVHTGKSVGDLVIGRDGRQYRLVFDRDIKAVVEAG